MSVRDTHASQRGISLVETLVGLAVFVVIAVSVYQSYATLLRVFTAARVQVLAGELANEQLEIIRNISYNQVGTDTGIPHGVVASTTVQMKGNLTFFSTTTIRNIDDPFDGVVCLGPIEMCANIDFSPADYKLVEILIACSNCGNDTRIFRFTGRVSPKNLETMTSNGALFIQAINANGEPVQGANVQVTNSTVNPPVNIMDTTDADGFLRIIDVPPAEQSYHVTVSKPDYSTDQTYATSTANPNPIAPPLTVVAQAVTQASFVIDRTSLMLFSSVTETCGPVSPTFIYLSLVSSKLIGRDPDVLKHPAVPFAIPSRGSVFIDDLEWDTYTISLAPQQGGYDLAGTIPLSPFVLAPSVVQNAKLIMKLNDPQGVLVTVRDAATGLPLTGASVTLAGATYEQTLATGRGFLKQTDWSSGSGQANFTDPAMYAEDDGNIDGVSIPGVVQLKLAVGGAARSREPRQFVRRAFADPQV